MTPYDQPEGVWIHANHYPHEGIVMATPYANEIEALRAANATGIGGRVVFVPYGKDLREVLNG
ncbi:hypothetical protein [Nocardia sp. N2S4-5]|uniref:hypothetical protein n=1 Tax=Nocardia sp. N2S4-5 TaxID=3351565 RepID=UPI0037D271CE